MGNFEVLIVVVRFVFYLDIGCVKLGIKYMGNFLILIIVVRFMFDWDIECIKLGVECSDVCIVNYLLVWGNYLV